MNMQGRAKAKLISAAAESVMVRCALMSGKTGITAGTGYDAAKETAYTIQWAGKALRAEPWGARGNDMKTSFARTLCCRIVLKITLAAGGASVSAYGDAPPPQGPCPLPSRARRTGIESRDEERKKGFAERSLWAA